MQNFSEVELPQALFHRLEQIGFTTPTPIQAQAIPAALKGADILGSAQTGTGKTGAYGIPLITQLLNSPRGDALILLPTRELADQVVKALQQFIGKSKISTALLIGGDSMSKQMRQLKMNPRLIVGTPGRINDHLTRGSLRLNNTNFLVLDEVDRMLDMGFGVQLDAIAKFLTGKRQTLMFTATLPKSIEKLASKYLIDPVRISVGATHEPAKNISIENLKVSDADKFPTLLDQISKREGSIIVFVKTKRAADRMADKLKKQGHAVDALHGDLRQNKRTQVVKAFHKQNFRILIATDVAARGLDIPHIEHVINHDLPQCPEDFIHRIGRTARAGAKGEAINFISPADNSKWRAIQRLLDPSAKAEDFGGGNGEKSGKSRSGRPGGRSGRLHRGKRPGGSDKPGEKSEKRKPAPHWKKKTTAKKPGTAGGGNGPRSKPKRAA